MDKQRRFSIIINAVLFQLTWFACVIGSANQLTWPGVLACFCLFLWQWSPQRRHPGDGVLVASAIIFGLIIDTFWVQSGLFSFTYNWPIPGMAPAWIIILWIGFALTINHSLSWLKTHPLLPALMGLIGGPLSYLAGVKFGAMELKADHVLVCSSLGIVWAIALTLLYLISLKTSNRNELESPANVT